MATPGTDTWAVRIEREFVQCPALRLTTDQAARLWGLEAAVVDTLLGNLVARRVLARTEDGRYVRRGACPRCE